MMTQSSVYIGVCCMGACILLAWQLRFATGKLDMDDLLSLMVPSSTDRSVSDNDLQRMHLIAVMDTAVNSEVQPKKKDRRKKPRRPVENLKVPTPIFVLSLPKSGTSSLYMYFHCGGIKSTHTYSKTGGRLGICMKKNYLADTPLLDGCRLHEQMFSDIGYTGQSRHGSMFGASSCFYPSLQALDRIIRDYPNSTIIVSYRSTGWHDSIKTFNGLKSRWRSSCDVFPNTSDPHVWEDFYVEHRRRIREAVQGQPTIRYLEFDLKDPTAGHQLENFTGISHECFGDCKPNFRCTYTT
eukprot:scaffold528_cov165-Amphora_coffeaeformis.AAC.49